MNKKTKKILLTRSVEFLKLQVAGNILFWGTFLGNTLLMEVFCWPSYLSLPVASIVFHGVFFVVDKNWVFSDKTGQRKTKSELFRFTVFMSFNYFLNLVIILGLEQQFGVSVHLGQFVASAIFAVWSYLGLKYWVFRYVRHAHHYALTIEQTKEKRHARYQRLATKQKAKRTA